MAQIEWLHFFGGLALLLFGMHFVGMILERHSGHSLRAIFSNTAHRRSPSVLLGLLTVSLIQSSSATAAIVIHFVNSGIVTLSQAVRIMLHSDIGTAMVAWVLSLGSIGQGSAAALEDLCILAPILALIGSALFFLVRNAKRKDIGMLLMGVSLLMYGVELMSYAMRLLTSSSGLQSVLSLFSNPFLGLLLGLLLTVAVQSSGVAVGIVQVMTLSGGISVGSLIPIVIGQDIGICVSVMRSSVGASRPAKRTAVVYLLSHVLMMLVLLPVYGVALWQMPVWFTRTATPFSVALLHTILALLFAVLCVPLAKPLIHASRRFVKKGEEPEEMLLDERLFLTPSVAVERCRRVTNSMAEISVSAMCDALQVLQNYQEETARSIRANEARVDVYEDQLGSYLVKLSSHSMSDSDHAQAAEILHIIGDFERISDHAVNILNSAEEIREKRLSFSGDAKRELAVMCRAVAEVLELAKTSFLSNSYDTAVKVEPLEEVIDLLKSLLKKHHIARLQRNECTIELGFILTDIVTNLERVSDHCSNIANSVIEMGHDCLDVHAYTRALKEQHPQEYSEYLNYYAMKYKIQE